MPSIPFLINQRWPPTAEVIAGFPAYMNYNCASPRAFILLMISITTSSNAKNIYSLGYPWGFTNIKALREKSIITLVKG
jgi:hypothetical protein